MQVQGPATGAVAPPTVGPLTTGYVLVTPSASRIAMRPPCATTSPWAMYIPSPEPPVEPCFQNFVNTRLRIDGAIPSPSS